MVKINLLPKEARPVRNIDLDLDVVIASIMIPATLVGAVMIGFWLAGLS